MAADYHYSRDGQSFGPVSVEQLRALAAEGQLSGNDLIWKEGMAEWLPASRFKGLIPAAPVTPAVVVPSTDSAPEFRLSDAAPAPVMPAAAIPRPAAQSETHEEPTQAEVFARQAKEVALAAGTDALKAFKALAKNPVGGLRTAFDALGPTRAMQVGIVFAILFDVSLVLAAHAVVSAFVNGFQAANGGRPIPDGPGWGIVNTIKLIILGAVPFGGAIGGLAIVRLKYKSQGSVQSDMFVAGASLLPVALAVILLVLCSMIDVVSVHIMGWAMVFAVTTAILILYSGFTTLQGIPEAPSTLVVPLVILFDFYVFYLVGLILG